MKEEIESIKERNKRVETDKAWETSKTRRAIIALMTYFVIVIFLYAIGVSEPWFVALVPAIGYVLSTSTLAFFKRFWVKEIYKK